MKIIKNESQSNKKLRVGDIVMITEPGPFQLCTAKIIDDLLDGRYVVTIQGERKSVALPESALSEAIRREK